MSAGFLVALGDWERSVKIEDTKGAAQDHRDCLKRNALYSGHSSEFILRGIASLANTKGARWHGA